MIEHRQINSLSHYYSDLRIRSINTNIIKIQSYKITIVNLNNIPLYSIVQILMRCKMRSLNRLILQGSNEGDNFMIKIIHTTC